MSDLTCSTDNCARPVRSRGMCNAHYIAWLKATPKDARPRPTVEERFWKYVDKGGPDECWEWSGAKNSGYGCLLVDGRSTLASRLSLAIDGHVDQPGLDACHKCDNPGCVNPKHLYYGTRQQNIDDAVRRKRIPLGEQKTQHKLTEKDVLYIREESIKGATFTSLAKELNVNTSTVSDVARGRKWKHVGGPISNNRRRSYA